MKSPDAGGRSYTIHTLHPTTLTGQRIFRTSPAPWAYDFRPRKDKAPVVVAGLFRQASRLLLPLDCTICDQPLTDDPVPFFCRACWKYIRPLQGPACPRCRRPFASAAAMTYSPTHECHDCHTRNPYYRQVWAAYASFFAHEGHALPWGPQLERQARTNIANRAYWSAVSHRVRGMKAESIELMAFSRSLDPAGGIIPPFAYWLRVENSGTFIMRRLREILTRRRLPHSRNPKSGSMPQKA